MRFFMRYAKHKSVSEWIRIWLAGLSLILILSLGISGCATTGPIRIMPTAPILEPEKIDKRICFTEEDAKELGVYIIELQRCCDQ